MKFIYCLNPAVAEDLEKAGLKKLGDTVINGKVVPYFENRVDVYVNKYQKGHILLSNQLFFAQDKE